MSQLFQTQNTPLAVTLLTCGVPVPRDEHDLPMPMMNVYDAETLRRLGYGGGQWKIEDAVRDAWKNKRPGIVVYNFVRSDLQHRLCEAWDKQSAFLQEQAFGQVGTGARHAGQSKLDPVEAVRFACQLFKNRKQTIEDWRIVTPFILLEGESRIESGGTDAEGREVSIVIGSYKGYFITASAEDRAHLKV